MTHPEGIRLPTGLIRPPLGGEVMADGRLGWRWECRSADNGTTIARATTDTRRMLEAFIRIRGAKDVITFATRYGTLGICEHGRPHTHARTTDEWGRPVYCGPELPPWQPDRTYTSDLPEVEPLDRWLAYAREARALGELAGQLSRSDVTEDEDLREERYRARLRCWRELYRDELAEEGQAKARGDYQPDPPDWSFARPSWEDRIEGLSRDRAQSRHGLLRRVNHWIQEGDVRPRLTFRLDPDEWSGITLTLTTFGVLAVQLLALVLGARELAVCDGCGAVYPRAERRSPVGPAGRRNYCTECGKRAAWRDGQRARRARLKSQGGAP